MRLFVDDPVLQTALFSIVFFLALIFVKVDKSEGFSKELTNQLKGVSILGIVLGHIGYFLSSDSRFLYPFSIISGVGVNLFLFLSGFGLAMSQLGRAIGPLAFYKKRLLRLYLPIWIVMTAFLMLDLLLLQRSYPTEEIVKNYLGLFTSANPAFSFNSPLWYFTLILFYYLVFPWVFFKRIVLISPLLILLLSLLLVRLPLPISQDNYQLFKLHLWAFPLGVALALFKDRFRFSVNRFLSYCLLAVCGLVFSYTAVHSGVGEGIDKEQLLSLVTMFSLIGIFFLSRLSFKLFSWFGVYSYEVYLIHWPLLTRFNIFSGMPPFLMVTLELILFLLLGFLIQRLVSVILRRTSLKE